MLKSLYLETRNIFPNFILHVLLLPLSSPPVSVGPQGLPGILSEVTNTHCTVSESSSLWQGWLVRRTSLELRNWCTVSVVPQGLQGFY